MIETNTNWAKTTTGDLCDYITSGSRDWKSFYSDAGALFIRTQDINKDRLELSNVAYVKLPEKVEGKRSRLQPGDILVTITGANVGKAAVVPEGISEAYVSQSVGLLRLKDKRHAPFLHYYLQSEQTGRKHLLGLVYGIGRPVLSLQNLRDVPVLLPDLSTQRRVVAEIEKQFTRLDAGVAALRRVQANLKRYRAAVLKAACEGRLVPTEAELQKSETRGQTPKAKSKTSHGVQEVVSSDLTSPTTFETGEQLLARILTERRKKWAGRSKYKEPTTPNTLALPKLPTGWVWASLDQLLQNITDGDHLPPPQTDSGIPFLVIGNVRTGKVRFEDSRFVAQEYYNAIDAYRKPQKGDILYTLVGSYGIGLRVDTNQPFCVQRHIGVMRPHEISPSAYLVHVLNSRFVFQQATSSATGTAQKTVPLAGLRRFAIPVPPTQEIQRIVAEVERRLSVIDELETLATANLTRATRLRQSILQQAFTGNLSKQL